MAEPDSDQVAFAHFVAAIAPRLGEIVLTGGWAHRLYLLDPRAGPIAFEPLMTTDADFVTIRRATPEGPSISELLLEAGFVRELSGDGQDPVAKYRLKNSGFYVEFLVPIPPGRRDLGLKATEEISGVIAQRLRYVELLLEQPLNIQLTREKGFRVEADGLTVRVANPVSYLAQKVLALPSRKPSEKRKDVLYVHDTILIFGNVLPELRLLWKSIAPSVSSRVRSELIRLIAETFGAPGDVAYGAAQIAARSPRSSPPSAIEITAVCLRGLTDIFQA